MTRNTSDCEEDPYRMEARLQFAAEQEHLRKASEAAAALLDTSTAGFAPSRTQITSVIANEYGVSMETAEGWIRAAFAERSVT